MSNVGTVEVLFRLGLKMLKKDVKAAQKELNKFKDVDIGINIDYSGLKSDVSKAKKELDKVKDVTIEIDANSNNFKREFDSLTRERQSMKIGVDADVSQASRNIGSLQGDIRSLSSYTPSIQVDTSSAERAIDGLLEKVKSAGSTVITIGAGAAATAGVAGVTNIGYNQERTLAMNRMRSSTSGVSDEALGNTIKEITSRYNVGQMEAAEIYATSAQRYGAVTSENFDKVSADAKKNALFSSTSGVDGQTVARSIDAISKSFGVSDTEAYDFLAEMQKEGLNLSDDFYDTMIEYGEQFKKFDMSLGTVGATIKAGRDNGGYNTDKIGDAIKEMPLRVQDFSSESMGALVGEMAEMKVLDEKAFKKAVDEGDVKKYNKMLVDAIKKADADPKNAAIVDRWISEVGGGPGEDLGKEAFFATMDAATSDEELEYDGSFTELSKEVEEANKEMAEFNKAVEELKEAFLPFSTTLMEIGADVLPPVTNAIEGVVEKFNSLGDGTQKVILLGGALLALSPVLALVTTSFSSLVKTVGSFGKFVANIASNGIGKKMSSTGGCCYSGNDIGSDNKKDKKKGKKKGASTTNSNSNNNSNRNNNSNNNRRSKLGTLSKAGKAAGIAGVAIGGYHLYDSVKNDDKRGIADASGSLAGAAGGAALGATIGSVIPGLGTLAGGAIGGVVGGIAGSGIATGLYDAVTQPSSGSVQEQLDVENARKQAEEIRMLTEDAKYTTMEASTAVVGNMENMRAGSVNKMLEMRNSGLSTFTSMTGDATTSSTAMTAAVTTGMTNTAASVSTNGGTVKANASSIFSATAEIASNNLNLMPGSGALAMTNTAASVLAGGGALGEAASAAFGVITEKAQGVAGKMYGIGSDIVRGIYKGIIGMKDWFAEKAGGFFSSITDIATSVLDIHSPSRVFASEVGMHIPTGIAVGIEKTSDVPLKTIADMENELVASSNVDLTKHYGLSFSKPYVNKELGEDVTNSNVQPTVVNNIVIEYAAEFTATVKKEIAAELRELGVNFA